MPFAEIDTKTQYESKKKQYLTLSQGQTVIRILEDTAQKFYTHYINRSTVQCLGDACPICANNRVIYMEHPDDFRSVQGYSPKVQKFLVNVLDRTVGKICPNCGTDVKKVGGNFPPFCPKCETSVAEVKESPIDQVRVLSKGVTVFEQFDAFENSVCDDEGEPLPLTGYDIVLSVTGVKKDTKVVAIPLANKRDKIEVDPDDLYQLEDAIIKLDGSEIGELQRGISLKDIFASRRANKEIEAKAQEAIEVDPEEEAELEDSIEAMMSGATE